MRVPGLGTIRYGTDLPCAEAKSPIIETLDTAQEKPDKCADGSRRIRPPVPGGI